MEHNLETVHWLVRVRWIALALLALLFAAVESPPSLDFLTLWDILILAAAFNLLYHFLARVRRLTRLLIHFIFLVDGFFISLAVSLTGGPLSHYPPLYLIVIMAACLVSSPKGALWVTLEQAVLYFTTLYLLYEGRMPLRAGHPGPGDLAGLLPSLPPESVKPLYLEQAALWAVFFATSFSVCGLLVRQVWSREERLRVRERGLEQKRRLIQLGELTGRIAHGVNTPLGLVSGNLEFLLAETRKGSKVHRKLLELDHYVQRAIKTVRNTLDYSRQTMSQIRPVAMVEVLGAVVDSVQPKLKKNRGRLILDIAKDIPPVMGYPESLFQALLNLVENAVDSIPPDGVVTVSAGFQFKPVRLSAHDTRGDVRVQVRDTGKGIRPEELKRIFEPFYSTKGFGHGTGLGLSIVKRIMEEHRGEIRVESHMGHGTLFTLLFPTEGPAAAGEKGGEDSYNESQF